MSETELILNKIFEEYKVNLKADDGTRLTTTCTAIYDYNYKQLTALKQARTENRCAWKCFEGEFCPEAQKQLTALKVENHRLKLEYSRYIFKNNPSICDNKELREECIESQNENKKLKADLEAKNKEIEFFKKIMNKLKNTRRESESILNNNESLNPDYQKGQINIIDRVFIMLGGAESE